jgi:hypothetical protein
VGHLPPHPIASNVPVAAPAVPAQKPQASIEEPQFDMDMWAGDDFFTIDFRRHEKSVGGCYFVDRSTTASSLLIHPTSQLCHW